jgi:hypothetical protein
MTLSYSKFELYADDAEQVVLRCLVCGRNEVQGDGIRLDDAIEQADQHECAPLRVTAGRACYPSCAGHTQ